jgi:hypothetical protein
MSKRGTIKSININVFVLIVSLYRMFIKFILKVDVEESIVNAPLISLKNKNTNNAKSEVRFKQLIRKPGTFTIDSSAPTLRIHLNEHPTSATSRQL